MSANKENTIEQQGRIYWGCAMACPLVEHWCGQEQSEEDSEANAGEDPEGINPPTKKQCHHREHWKPNFMHVHASSSFSSRMTREVKLAAEKVVNETNDEHQTRCRRDSKGIKLNKLEIVSACVGPDLSPCPPLNSNTNSSNTQSFYPWTQVLPNPEPNVDPNNKGPRFYFNPNPDMPLVIPKGVLELVPSEHMQLHSPIGGFFCDHVCTLPPREFIVKHFTPQVARDGINAMKHAAQNVAPNLRGGARTPVTDKKQVECTSTGVYAPRNARGIKTNMKKLKGHPFHHASMSKLIHKIEHVSTAYMWGEAVTTFKVIKKICKFQGYPHPSGQEENESKVWPAIAFGPNVCLPKHTDQDSFFSAVNVLADDFSAATVAPPSEAEKPPKFRVDSPILCYFCFPDHGFAVGLQSGDVLLFNPCVPHCISARLDPEMDVFSSSMYLKT